MRGEQIRAARSLIGWKVSELAEASGVSIPTVQRMDATRGLVTGRHSTVIALKEALEAQDIQFLDTGEVAAGPGVALKSNRND